MAKVMLVEDDNNLREIYEARLAAEGYDIVAAQDGEEALALAVKERPDLIIADIMMPKVSGFDMLDILRSTPETKHAKIIMMTALSQAEDKTRAEKLGADRYLVKSQVTLEDVVKVASEMLNEAEGNQTPAIMATPSLDPPVTDPVSNLPTVAPDEPSSAVPADDVTTDDTSATAPAASPATMVTPEPVASSPVEVKEAPVATAVVPPAPKADVATATALSNTTAEEEAQVSQQIEDFINKSPTLTTSAQPEKDDIDLAPAATEIPTPEVAEAPKEAERPSEPADATFKEEVITSAPPVVSPSPSPEPKSTSIPVTIAEETAPEEPKVSLETPADKPVTTNEGEGTEADQTLAKAVDSLIGEEKKPDETTPTAPEATTDAPKEESDKPQLAKKRGGERVITPLSNPADAGLDLAALLAKEEDNDGIATPPINSVITPAGTIAQPTTSPADGSAPDFTDGAATPGSVVQPPSNEVSSEDSPNNIAL